MTIKDPTILLMDESQHIRPIERSIPIALLRARESVMCHFRPLLVARGYTEQQWRVLRILNEMGSLEATSLARHSALLMPSLTRIVKTLEDKALIRRTKDAQDGRRFLITLTARGVELIASEASRIEAVYNSIEQYMGPAKTQLLLELLSDLAAMEPPAKP
ncbi:MAG: homoprotocatechuate degradation operon regulator HpaR [Pseudomonadota bacterium]